MFEFIKKHLPLLIFLVVSVLFLYKFFFLHLVPFPGDLLISEYNPWKSFSYLGYVPGSYPNHAQYFDVLRQFYPWKILVIDSLKDGTFPLWNPYNFSGTPLFANFQSAVLYPATLLFLMFPFSTAWGIYLFLQIFLSLIFTYLFARSLNLSKLASYFAAFAFAFSNVMVVWFEYGIMGHSILWLPFILFCIEKFLTKGNRWYILGISFGIVASLFAGHPQLFFYLLFFVVTYSFIRSFGKKQKSFFIILVAIGIGVGLGAIQLIPGFELISHASRSPHVYEEILQLFLIQPHQLIMFFVPDFFGNAATRNYYLNDTYIAKVTGIGIPSLFLLSIVFFQKKIWFTKDIKSIFIWFSVIVLFLMTLNPLTVALYAVEIPFLSSSTPTILIFILAFTLSILSGFGVDTYITQKKFPKIPFILLLLIFTLLWLGVFIGPRLFSLDPMSLAISKRNLTYSTFLFFLSAVLFLGGYISGKKKIIIVGFIILLLGEQFRYFYKFNPFVPEALVFPKNELTSSLDKNTVDRFWGFGAARIDANLGASYKLYSPEGYDPLYPKVYGEYIGSIPTGTVKKFTDQTRSDAVIPSDLSNPDIQKRIIQSINFLGVGMLLDTDSNASTQKTLPPENFKKIQKIKEWNIYENKTSYPRAFLVNSYQVFSNEKDLIRKMNEIGFQASQSALLYSKPISILEFPTIKEVKIISYNPEKILLEVNTNANSLLVLTDTYYPGWSAYIDGHKTEVIQAYHAFRAIEIPAGMHEVRFSYEPLSFKVGLIVSITSLFCLILLMYFVSIKGAYKNV